MIGRTCVCYGLLRGLIKFVNCMFLCFEWVNSYVVRLVLVDCHSLSGTVERLLYAYFTRVFIFSWHDTSNFVLHSFIFVYRYFSIFVCK